MGDQSEGSYARYFSPSLCFEKEDNTLPWIQTSILATLVAGATAKAKDVASKPVSDAYNGLKILLIRKLGKGGAVQSVEDEPDSEPVAAAKGTALRAGTCEQKMVDRFARSRDLKVAGALCFAAYQCAPAAAGATPKKVSSQSEPRLATFHRVRHTCASFFR